MNKKKHTIQECKLKYESSNEFSLKDIADWSGYSIQHIKRVSAKNGWQKGILRQKETEEALKKQSEANVDKMLEIKELLDNGSMNNAKVAIKALQKVHKDENIRPFEKLKCSRIFEEIVEKIKRNLGILNEQETNNEIFIKFIDSEDI